MNLKNKTLLTESFPKLYSAISQEKEKYSKGEPFHPIAFGFDCGDGWFPLLYKLSIQLENYISSLPEDAQSIVYAVQVKEKFGTLRFYMSSYSEEMDAYIVAAEKESSKTCEVCGNPGITLGESWLSTLCLSCYVNGSHTLRNVNSQSTQDYFDYWFSVKREIDQNREEKEKLKSKKIDEI